MKQRINDYGIEKNNFKKYSDIKSILKYGVQQDITPDLSVVIPTYHREKYLKEAVDSAIQDFAGLNVEIIIVENDFYEINGTSLYGVLQSYSAEIVHYYQNERNIGMFGNWNRCFELARAPWVAMLHDDDLLGPHYYAKAKEIIHRMNSKRNVVYIKANAAQIKDGVKIELSAIKKIFYHFFATKTLCLGKKGVDIVGPDRIGMFGACSCGSLMKRSAYLDGGGFDEDHYPNADAQYPVKLVVDKDYRIGQTIGTLGFYRWEDNASYKETVIIGFAEELKLYVQYYAKRNAFTRWMYCFFSDEMINNNKKFIYECIDNSTIVDDKQRLRETVDTILPTNKRIIRMKIYKYIFEVYFRFKQFLAVMCFF